MEFLFSNYPPVKTRCKTFVDTFYMLLPQTSRLDIAVGYVSADSLLELKRILELNENISELNLIVGMHYFECFTKVQYKATLLLNEYLKSCKKGKVKLVTAFKYHGKLFSFSGEDGPFAGIIGSNNLSSIIETGTRVYESSFLINDKEHTLQMQAFVEELSKNASRNISELEIETFIQANPVLEGHESVTKIPTAKLIEIGNKLSKVIFEIPTKATPKSNLNCYHGKGRENTRTRVVKPRHWYEVELIVPIDIRKSKNYPKGSPKGEKDTEFTVYTDDGFCFKCQVNGGEEGLWNKNLCSSRDLTILGKWIKGRLENEGVLVVGDVVTEKTLKEYGRNTITMTKIDGTDDWFLDFGVKK